MEPSSATFNRKGIYSGSSAAQEPLAGRANQAWRGAASAARRSEAALASLLDSPARSFASLSHAEVRGTDFRSGSLVTHPRPQLQRRLRKESLGLFEHHKHRKGLQSCCVTTMQDKYPASTREEAPLTSVLVRPGSHLSSSLASGLSSRLTGPAGRAGVFCGVLKLTLMTNILNERISHFFF